MTEKTKMTDYSIASGAEIDPALLLDFYERMYPDRTDLHRIWKWRTRPEIFQNRVPVVIMVEGRVMAHAGVIPFKIAVDREVYKAAWCVDFAVLSELRGQGLGTLITREWMKVPDLGVECGHTPVSGAVFNKCGFKAAGRMTVHYFALLPFHHALFEKRCPAFLRTAFNSACRPFLKRLYTRHGGQDENAGLVPLDSGFAERAAGLASHPDNAVHPVRDKDYLTWRLVDSPDRDKYRVLEIDGVMAVLKLADKRAFPHVDILWISDLSGRETVRRLISISALWAQRRGFSHIRFFTSDQGLSVFLKKSLKSVVRKPGFMYYARDPRLFKALEARNWDWQLIDNDHEVF